MEVGLLARRHRTDRDREAHQVILTLTEEHTGATSLVLITGWHPYLAIRIPTTLRRSQ